MNETLPASHHGLWWKALAASCSVLLLLFISWFVFQVVTYYRAIKSGVAVEAPMSRVTNARAQAMPTSELSPDLTSRLADASAPSYGPASAALTVVEFVDYGCPFSEASFGPFRSVMGAYGDRVHFVVRNFPIDDLHPRATASAIAASCAQAQGKFWGYYDKLYLNPSAQEDADLTRYAQEVGLDAAAFARCQSDPATLSRVQADQALGFQAAVRGTPTFFFNGIRLEGVADESRLRGALDALLKQLAQAK